MLFRLQILSKTYTEKIQKYWRIISKSMVLKRCYAFYLEGTKFSISNSSRDQLFHTNWKYNHRTFAIYFVSVAVNLKLFWIDVGIIYTFSMNYEISRIRKLSDDYFLDIIDSVLRHVRDLVNIRYAMPSFIFNDFIVGYCAYVLSFILLKVENSFATLILVQCLDSIFLYYSWIIAIFLLHIQSKT